MKSSRYGATCTAVILSAVLLNFSISSGKDMTAIQPVTGAWLRDCEIPYEADGKKHTAFCQIYFPKGYRQGSKTRALLALHGYRFTRSDWERHTNIEEYADRYGFVLICPGMSITLYESRYYPESRSRWGALPGGHYVVKVLIPYLQKRYGIARDRRYTGIFGLSTGGRGALLLAALHKPLFGATAGLSGDYDPEGMPDDPLLTSIYGRFVDHPDRWKKDDNVMALAGDLRGTSVFLGHGSRDRLVPPAQTAVLVDKLRRLSSDKGGFDLTVENRFSPGAGHDWAYWRACVPEMMRFFNEKLAGKR